MSICYLAFPDSNSGKHFTAQLQQLFYMVGGGQEVTFYKILYIVTKKNDDPMWPLIFMYASTDQVFVLKHTCLWRFSYLIE